MPEAPGEWLVFEMGLYKARFPTSLLYCRTHFWLQLLEGNRTRCGLTAYAARLLGDLFCIEWRVEPGTPVQDGQLLGQVESTKAAAELYSPMSGRLTAANPAVVGDPSLVSLDPYGAWLLELEGRPQHTLSPAGYVAFLAAGWDETRQRLKGQE